MKSLTVAPAEVYNQEKGHPAQTTCEKSETLAHSQPMARWNSSPGKTRAPRRYPHRGVNFHNCYRPLLCWALAPEMRRTWDLRGQLSASLGCPPQGAVMSALIKNELQFCEFLLMLTWGHFWSVYGEGEWAPDKRRSMYALHTVLSAFRTIPQEP